MKKRVFKKTTLLYLLTVIGISIIGIFLMVAIIAPKKETKVETVALKSVSTQILAEGTVRSQNEATLHFQTGGKITYLAVKEGDQVSAGQTIASLDTYTIQKQLEAALNTYRSTRDTFDQTQQNAQYNILQAQQKNQIDASRAGVGGTTETDVVNDIAKRIVDQNQANLDNSVIQVQLANYAFSLASITSPIDGVVIHEDVTTPYINVTPQTSFMIADPNALVFRANVPENQINYIAEGSQATVTLSGLKDRPVVGIVTKIYPDKQILPTGENIYQVDISASDLQANAKYHQDGVVLINNRYNQPVMLVPSWLVLNKQYIWVMEQNKPVLKHIVVGDTVDDKTQVFDGLTTKDQIIVNPAAVAAKHYITL